MNKTTLGLDDFVIATKTDRPTQVGELAVRSADNSDRKVTPQAAKVLPRLSESDRRDKATARAIVREDARLALKQLKRAKEREAKFYVNVALSYVLKNRLKKAAHENDVNMTIIMQAAIESYLQDNGY